MKAYALNNYKNYIKQKNNTKLRFRDIPTKVYYIILI